MIPRKQWMCCLATGEVCKCCLFLWVFNCLYLYFSLQIIRLSTTICRFYFYDTIYNQHLKVFLWPQNIFTFLCWSFRVLPFAASLGPAILPFDNVTSLRTSSKIHFSIASSVSCFLALKFYQDLDNHLCCIQKSCNFKQRKSSFNFGSI